MKQNGDMIRQVSDKRVLATRSWEKEFKKLEDYQSSRAADWIKRRLEREVETFLFYLRIHALLCPPIELRYIQSS